MEKIGWNRIYSGTIHFFKNFPQVYEELKLKKTMIKHIDEKKSDIYSAIQGIAKLDKAGLTTEFFLQLLENMDIHNIS